MRVAIVGSRGWTDRKAIFDYVAALPKDTVIVSGEARGADTIAKEAAAHYGLAYDPYPADWKRYGRSAGIIRNQELVANCDRLVAFQIGDSPGTCNVIEAAMQIMKPVLVFYPENGSHDA